MRQKTLIVEDWDTKVSHNLQYPEDQIAYDILCEKLYPEHKGLLTPTCDHCGQQNLVHVVWAQSAMLPGPDNWARIGSSCLLEWYADYLGDTFLFDDSQLEEFRRAVKLTKLNKTVWLSAYNGWWSGLPWRRLQRLLLPRDDKYTGALVTTPWVVLTFRYPDGSTGLTVQLNDNEDFPSNIRPLIKLVPELRHSSLITRLQGAGLPIPYEKVFNETRIENALVSFKAQLQMWLLAEMRTILESNAYTVRRAVRISTLLNKQSHVIEQLEGTGNFAKLMEARQLMAALWDAALVEASKDESFKTWCTVTEEAAQRFIGSAQASGKLSEKQTLALAELMRREQAGEP